MRKIFITAICLSIIAIGSTALSRSSYARDDSQPYKWEVIDKSASDELTSIKTIKVVTEKLVVDHGYIIRTIVITRSGTSVFQTFVVTNH